MFREDAEKQKALALAAEKQKMATCYVQKETPLIGKKRVATGLPFSAFTLDIFPVAFREMER
jgi:hypothetical protein